MLEFLKSVVVIIVRVWLKGRGWGKEMLGEMCLVDGDWGFKC